VVRWLGSGGRHQDRTARRRRHGGRVGKTLQGVQGWTGLFGLSQKREIGVLGPIKSPFGSSELGRIGSGSRGLSV
jgi:hypothetical protein